MTLRIFLTLIIISISTSVLSQSSFIFAFNQGASVPFSDLKSSVYTKTEAGGFAKIGYNYGLQLRYYIYNGFGLGFDLNYQRFNVNEQKWAEVAFEPGIDEEITVTAQKWKSQSVCGGVFYRYKVFDKIQLEHYAMIGRNATISPNVDIWVVQKAISFELNRPAAISKSSNLQIGSNILFDIKDGIFLFAGFQYHLSNHNFVYYVDSEPDPISIQFLNINLGIGFYIF